MKRQNLISAFAELVILALASRCLARRRRRSPGRQLAVLSQDTIGEAVVLHEIYERRELEALIGWLQLVHPEALGATALDVGANIGNHATFFAQHFKSCIAFEPNPRVFALLSFNAADHDNLEVRNIGLSDAAGMARLAVPSHNAGGARVVPAGDGVAIPLERLDDQDLGGAAVGLIKLDVEGHELQALQGGRKIIARHRPIVVLEQHASEISNGSSPVLDLLRDAGYTQFFHVGRPSRGMLRGFKPMRVLPLSNLERRNYPMLVAVSSAASRT